MLFIILKDTKLNYQKYFCVKLLPYIFKYNSRLILKKYNEIIKSKQNKSNFSSKSNSVSFKTVMLMLN